MSSCRRARSALDLRDLFVSELTSKVSRAPSRKSVNRSDSRSSLPMQSPPRNSSTLWSRRNSQSVPLYYVGDSRIKISDSMYLSPLDTPKRLLEPPSGTFQTPANVRKRRRSSTFSTLSLTLQQIPEHDVPASSRRPSSASLTDKLGLLPKDTVSVKEDEMELLEFSPVHRPEHSLSPSPPLLLIPSSSSLLPPPRIICTSSSRTSLEKNNFYLGSPDAVILDWVFLRSRFRVAGFHLKNLLQYVQSVLLFLVKRVILAKILLRAPKPPPPSHLDLWDHPEGSHLFRAET
ncbi:unnamed protein product, partial [Cyprideis torosa]